MRFHHSTRRGRVRQPTRRAARSAQFVSVGSSSRWSHLSHCRDTDIYFNRRQIVEPPPQAALGGQRHEHQESPNLPPEPLETHLELGRLSLEEAERQSAARQQKGMAEPEANRREPETREAAAAAAAAGLDLELVRRKIVAQVNKHPFWSKKAAKRMQLSYSESRQIYTYELTSYCERRELQWRFEPYKGPLSITARRSAAHLLDMELCSTSDTSAAAKQSRSWLTVAPPAPPPPVPLSPGERPRAAEREHKWRRRNSASGHLFSSSLSGTREDTGSSGGGGGPQPSASYIWSIEAGVPQPEPFANYVVDMELPASSFVKKCHGCDGRGRLKCGACHGVGYEVCASCSGKGATRTQCKSRYYSAHDAHSSSSKSRSASALHASDWSAYPCAGDQAAGDEPRRARYEDSAGAASGLTDAWTSEFCHLCHGSGQRRCKPCAGRSYSGCSACAGLGQLRCYQSLTITRTNYRDEAVLNNSDRLVTRDRLRLCDGLLLVDRQADRLRPLTAVAPEAAADERRQLSPGQLELASRRLLERHRAQHHKSERLLRQRHKLTLIKCHIIEYEWKQRRGQFVLYGEEGKVYIAKYPFKSLCNIM